MSPPTPKRAPQDVPVEAAFYLDKAADGLSALAKDKGLQLKPYESHAPGRTWWTHGMYGTCRDRQICIQVVTDARMATTFTADIKGWMTHVFPDGRDEWVPFVTRRVEGMEALMAGVAEMTAILRRACDSWVMPDPPHPDLKN